MIIGVFQNNSLDDRMVNNITTYVRLPCPLLVVFHSNFTHAPSSLLLPRSRPSGFLPDTVMVVDNKLMVKKVDYAVNTTFICEAKNKLGTGRQQMSTIVIGESGKTPPNVPHVHLSHTYTHTYLQHSIPQTNTHTHARRHERQCHTCWDQG